VAIVHFGEQHQEIAGSRLGLVELAGTDEFGSGVGRDGEFVLVSVLGAGEARRDGGFHLTKVQAVRGGGFGSAFNAPRFGLGKLLAPPPPWQGSISCTCHRCRRGRDHCVIDADLAIPYGCKLTTKQTWRGTMLGRRPEGVDNADPRTRLECGL
jgi:hypothetical protein